MLLKLCATGTLLLQAFQGKGAVKRLDISSFMRMGLYETDKKEGKSHTFYVIKAKIFGDLWRKCIAGAWVQLWYCRCLSTRQRTSEQRRLCSLALLTSSIPLSHRRERLDWFDNIFISSVVCSCHYDSDSELKLMKVGTIAPKKFIARLRKEKVEFDNYMQQVIA